MLIPVINKMVKELGKIKDSNEITPEFELNLDEHPLVWPFKRFYNNLNLVVRKKLPSDTSTTTFKTVNSPLQAAVSPKPRWSLSSTESTASSAHESKPEHHTDALANDFVWATLTTLENTLKTFAWYHDGKTRLQFTSILSAM